MTSLLNNAHWWRSPDVFLLKNLRKRGSVIINTNFSIIYHPSSKLINSSMGHHWDTSVKCGARLSCC